MLSTADPKDLLSCLQEKTKERNPEEEDSHGDKEPFDVLVDALSGVVKDHLSLHGKEYITKDYVEKLHSTLSRGVAIDLRTEEEKSIVENYRKHHRIDVRDKNA